MLHFYKTEQEKVEYLLRILPENDIKIITRAHAKYNCLDDIPMDTIYCEQPRHIPAVRQYFSDDYYFYDNVEVATTVEYEGEVRYIGILSQQKEAIANYASIRTDCEIIALSRDNIVKNIDINNAAFKDNTTIIILIDKNIKGD